MAQKKAEQLSKTTREAWESELDQLKTLKQKIQPSLINDANKLLSHVRQERLLKEELSESSQNNEI